VQHKRKIFGLCKGIVLVALLVQLPSWRNLYASDAVRHTALQLGADDVIPTGNQWIALPDIRAVDGALMTFNVLSMHNRGLLQVNGENGAPVLQPYFMANGKPLLFRNPSWELTEYWIPTAHLTVNGLDLSLTWCAPQGSRGAFLHMKIVNRTSSAVPVVLGLKASWGTLSRVTYLPVTLHGEKTMAAAPWVDPATVFSFVTSDTRFAWSLLYPGSEAISTRPPLSNSPELDAQHAKTLQPGESTEADFILGAGIEEFSAAHSAKAIGEILNRHGSGAVIEQTAEWCQKRTRTTGQADLDLLMNRNFLFTALYAWGKTIDTEQLVGVTSRSPRYYVSAAYWDRDAMLWSFPALLDIDTQWAKDALRYAFTVQLRDTGIHSRFIDGIVLEDGFQLDEAVAPLIAFSSYINKTKDVEFLKENKRALQMLLENVDSRYDARTGLYSSLQDSQDEYQKLPFLTYDNVLTWRAFLDTAALYERLGDAGTGQELRNRAQRLQAAIMKNCIARPASGSNGPIYVMATDGTHNIFGDVPPGSLMKLPALGFVKEDDPVFRRTYYWLHSDSYQYSYSDEKYGLPGSHRLPFTTSWEIADHLRLNAGRDKAASILRASNWDGGIITEGMNPENAVMDHAGRAFATAAGYVADAICQEYCKSDAMTNQHQ